MIRRPVTFQRGVLRGYIMKPEKASMDNHSGQSPETNDPEHPLDLVDPERGPLAGPEDTGRAEASRFLDLSRIEPFVKPEVVADYIGIDTATVVRFAALDILPGHPIRESGKRCHWRFLLSEVRRSMLSKTGKKALSNVRKKAQSKAIGS